MNDLAQERITKPKSDDMSMDEILASIRKIISSSDDVARHHKTDDNSSTSYARRNDAHDINHKMTQSASVLSAREQLLSLTKPDLYDTDFLAETHQKTTISNQSSERNPNRHYDNFQDEIKQKPLYQKLNHHTDTQANFDDKSDQDEEILRALNEIRETLSATAHSTIHHSLEKDIFNKQNSYTPPSTDNFSSDLPKKNIGKIIDTNTPKPKDTFDDIDLKPAQFTGDAVPEFLKKFKKQQEADREKIQNPANNIQYNFSKLSSFDDIPEPVVTLTEKVMPMRKDDLKQQQEKTAKTSFSKLRANTEEIMRRATERTVNDDTINDNPDDDLSHDDSTMADLIMRTLKPMLQEWIDENMQLIAEQVLRHEFRRGLK